jgi:hypothetical protein
MNARNLNKRSETDWARIDRMTDEEIDTSDIPPLEEEFFARAKWLLPRSYIDRLDFLEARKFASYILEKELYNERKTQRARTNQQLVHRAFNTSLIISYSRPFYWNKNFEGEPKSSLRKCVCEVLDKTEAELHRRILSQRDTIYAHSEAHPRRVKNLDYTKLIPIFYPLENLSKTDKATLKVMIGKWIKYLNDKIALMKRRRLTLPTQPK